jgi:glycine/sarcosine/betaine reductase complex component A
MDLENQKRIKDLTEEHGAENIIVVFGAAEGELTGLAAETVTIGDPTYAGCLTGVNLGLGVYHVVESTFKAACPADIFDEHIGMMEMILDVDDITNEITSIREEHSQFNK